MTARAFTEKQERYGGSFRTVARLTCRKCGVSDSISIRAVGGLLPPTVISKKMEQKGWTVGANEQWDMCPGCTNKAKDKNPTMLKVVDHVAADATSEQKPREMSRDERRIIFAKLNEVYLDEGRGYEGEWSDHRVATDLGVPRKWVEDIRVEMFGDAGTNAEMSEFFEQAKTLLAEARAILGEAREHYKKARALVDGAPSVKSIAMISDRLGKVEKLAEGVRKYVVTA